MMLSRRIVAPMAFASPHSVILTSLSSFFMKPILVRADTSRSMSNLSPEFIESLNKRDKHLERQRYKEELSQWTPLKSYGVEKLEQLNSQQLFDLSYIQIMYQMPLKEYQKVYIRKSIYEMYQKASSDVEKEMLYAILSYYKLLE